MRTQKFFLALASLCFAVLVSGQAFAVAIQGTLDMGGLFTPEDGSNNATNLGSAIHVQFDSDIVSSSAPPTGDFVGTTTGGLALADFDFSPLNPNPLNWTLGSFTLSLTSMTVGAQSDSALLLTGTGTLTGAGFDPTPATLSWTGNNGGSLHSWSATVSAVPVPAAVWLFGSGLLGLVCIARRRKAA
jgi:hypothetical protein